MFLNEVDESGWQYPYKLVYTAIVFNEVREMEIGLFAKDDSQAKEMAEMFLEIFEAKQVSLTKVIQED
jgi:hypothetical protein